MLAVGLFGFGHRFFCSHGLHIPEELCYATSAKLRTRAHHDTIRKAVYNPNNRRMNLHGRSFGKMIASNFYIGCRNVSIRWIRHFCNGLDNLQTNGKKKLV